MYLLRPYLNENSMFCIWLATQEKVHDKKTPSHVAFPAHSGYGGAWRIVLCIIEAITAFGVAQRPLDTSA